MSDCRVGELVAEHPSLSRVFQSYGLDFCCQGSRTLRQVCIRKGLDLDEVVAAIEVALQDPAPTAFNATELEPANLVKYIVETHHAYLKQELPRLYAMSERVARVHGGHSPTLIELFQTFSVFAEQISHYTENEETVVFPIVLKALDETDKVGEAKNAIDSIRSNYTFAGEALKQFRSLTGNYQPPPEACNTYRALFAGLAELDEDLQRHIHLETSVLFSAVV